MMLKNAAAISLCFLAVALAVCSPCAAKGTASDTVLTATVDMPLFNATSSAATSTNAVTVKAVYGFSTAAFTEESAKSAVAGATATYDFAILNNGNTAADIGIVVGAQSFSGTTGPTSEWSVAAERIGTGFLNFQNSATQTADQLGDTATATTVPASSSVTFRLHNKTSASAMDGASTTYSVSLRTNSFPGAPYTGFNGVAYAGPSTWSRQLDGGLVITTINGVVLAATKTLAVAAPAGYVSNGGAATDPVPGSAVNFNISFSNNGAVSASGVVVTDQLPPNTTFTAGSIKSCFTGSSCTPAADPDADGANPDCYYAAGPPRIICNIDSMAGGAGGALQYSVTID